MDTLKLSKSTLNSYREAIAKILKEYTKINYINGDISNQLICDPETDNYLVISQGWDNDKRIHHCLIHVAIENGKIWIQYDGTEDGITDELIATGIPHKAIVLGFHPTEIRQHTSYAIE